MSSQTGQIEQVGVIRCRAAVAFKPNQPLEVVEVEVAPPQRGEIRVKVISNALCHTDIYTLEGHDPEGIFPCILGHEATGVVESLGEGVTTFQVGDIVIPCYTPECQEYDCVFCQSDKTNLCPKIRATQGKGLMPDETTRFSYQGQRIYHFMGCSTFSEYTVIAAISAAKINPQADLNKVCLLGCGISTGWGAAMIKPVVTPGSTVAVWGLGAVGLAVIQAAKYQGAKKIYGFDINIEKFPIAKNFGATECHNPLEKNSKEWLLEREKWGVNFTYDCTGNVQVMRDALESAHRGFGESCIIGVAGSGKEIQTRPFQLVTGRKWMGTAFGGWKSVQDVPKLVNKVLLGELTVDQFVTHQYNNIDSVNQSIDALHSGNCLRAVISINQIPQNLTSQQQSYQVQVLSSQRHFGGVIKVVSHWSYTNQCHMKFTIFLPSDNIKDQRRSPYPVLYFLAGLSSNHENAPSKSNFGAYASKHQICIVFPDTSPRDLNIPGLKDHWDFGDSAGYYLNATTEQYKHHFNMYSYILHELPSIVTSYFHVSNTKQSITGFSMGGMGALNIALRNPQQYKSVSVFSPVSRPLECPWGQKAFKLYLGSIENGQEYDPVYNISNIKGQVIPLFVDQGTADKFLDEQLLTHLFIQECKKQSYPVIYKQRDYYDHSYYFIASFIEEHIDFHARYLLI